MRLLDLTGNRNEMKCICCPTVAPWIILTRGKNGPKLLRERRAMGNSVCFVSVGCEKLGAYASRGT